MTQPILPPQFFITGTDTDAGKTVLAGVLCSGLGAKYWKPIQAGFPTDSQTMANWIGKDRVLPEGIVLNHPLSPNQAAELDSLTIDPSTLKLPNVAGPLIVEGAGGLMVPINHQFMMIDFIEQLNLPVVLAARSGLGTLNHSLLSINTLRSRGIPLLGVFLMGPPHPANARDIAHFGKVPILGQIDQLPQLSTLHLKSAFQKLSLQKPKK